VSRRTTYRVAGGPLLVEARDAWTADAIDALFAGWYLTPDASANGPATVPAIVLASTATPAAIPAGLTGFAVAGGGTCYTDGRTSYIDIDGSIVAIGRPEGADVEVWMDGPLPLESPALTRLVTYALSAALRQRRRYELHGGAVVDPSAGTGVLIAGPSGSGKSTMAVHLASAGWPFLTDDVLLLGADRDGLSDDDPDGVTAWPLRRRFAITPDTYAASGFLQARTVLEDLEVQAGKRPFAPHDVFAGGFRDRCRPGVLVFPELTGAARTEVTRLAAGDTMARLIRMNPWSCYDRATAPRHLAVLSALTQQAAAFGVRAGRDLLDPAAAVDVVAGCIRTALDR
jgi:hypothetical protein